MCSRPAPINLRIDFDGIWDLELRASIESTLRACISEPPEGEQWSVLVTSFRDFCTVRVKTPRQTRSKLFLLSPSALSEVMPQWLKQNPPR